MFKSAFLLIAAIVTLLSLHAASTARLGGMTAMYTARAPLLHPVLPRMSDLLPAGSRAIDVPRIRASFGGAVDLSAWAVPTRDQGQVGSCAAFSTTSLRWWYLAHDTGVRPSDLFAPMYQYAQISKGVDAGSSFDDNFNIQVQQGTELLHDYSLGVQNGLTDYTDQPNGADHAAAAAYTDTGWHYIITNFGTSNAGILDAELHAGHPVEIGIAVYPEWMFYHGGVIGPHYQGEFLYGYHAIVIYGEDASGNFIGQNQWNTSWGIVGPTGQSGWFKVSPAFVNTELFAGSVIDGVHNPGPTPTAQPTAFPTVQPTAPPTVQPTTPPTSTPVPPVPTATPVHVTFPGTTYERYRVAHGLSLVRYTDAPGKLGQSAKLWWKHQAVHRAGGILRPEHYNSVARVMRVNYEGFTLYWWPGTTWTQWVKHTWVA